MDKVSKVVLVALILMSFSLTSFAADMPSKTGVKWSENSGKYSSGPVQKVERGFGNFFFGWTEIPKKIVDSTKQDGPFKGLVGGAWAGLCKAVARTTSGAADIVTFPVGKYDKPAIMPDMPGSE